MGARVVSLIIIIFLVLIFILFKKTGKSEEFHTVRVGVIGGMTMTNLWGNISRMFESVSGHRIDLVRTGTRPVLSEELQKGNIDLLTQHSGDITTGLVVDGFGIDMRAWTQNELVIIGPSSDPAGIKGMKDGVLAFKKIAETKSNFVDFLGIGPREMCHKLWRLAGIEQKGNWVVKDESTNHLDIMSFAKLHNAYFVMGRMPVIFHKVSDVKGMEILVEGDPKMRRSYIVMLANSERLEGINLKGGKELSDFLISKDVQKFITTFGNEKSGESPLFFPVWPFQEEYGPKK